MVRNAKKLIQEGRNETLKSAILEILDEQAMEQQKVET